MSKLTLKGLLKVFQLCFLFLVGIPVCFSAEGQHIVANLGPIPAGKVVSIQFPVEFKYCWYLTTDDDLGTAKFESSVRSGVIPNRIEYKVKGGGASLRDYGGDFVYVHSILENFPENATERIIRSEVPNTSLVDDEGRSPSLKLEWMWSYLADMERGDNGGGRYYYTPPNGEGIRWSFETRTSNWRSLIPFQGRGGLTTADCGYNNKGQGALYTEYKITDWLVDTRGLHPEMGEETEQQSVSISFESTNYPGVTIDVLYTAIDVESYVPNCTVFPEQLGGEHSIELGDVVAGSTKTRRMRVTLDCNYASTAVLQFLVPSQESNNNDGHSILTSDPTVLEPLPGTYLSLVNDDGEKVPLDGSEIYFTGLDDLSSVDYNIELDATHATSGGSFEIPMVVSVEANYRKDFSENN